LYGGRGVKEEVLLVLVEHGLCIVECFVLESKECDDVFLGEASAGDVSERDEGEQFDAVGSFDGELLFVELDFFDCFQDVGNELITVGHLGSVLLD
jgi:hypothetical protein